MRINPKVLKIISTQVQLVRYTNDESKWRLTIEDEASGSVILEIELDNEAIVNLISTRVGYSQKSSYYHHDHIGKTKKVKSEMVVNINGINPRDDIEKIYLLAEKMCPGWTAMRSEYNSRQHIKNTYLVTMIEYI